MVIGLSVALAISITVNIILYYLLSRSANISLLLEDKVNTLEQWVSDFQQSILTTYKNLKRVDESGIFESDDSVGFIFRDLVNILEVCNSRINDYNNPKNNITENNEQSDHTNEGDTPKSDAVKQPSIQTSTPYFNNEDREMLTKYINRKQQQTNL